MPSLMPHTSSSAPTCRQLAAEGEVDLVEAATVGLTQVGLRVCVCAVYVCVKLYVYVM